MSIRPEDLADFDPESQITEAATSETHPVADSEGAAFIDQMVRQGRHLGIASHLFQPTMFPTKLVAIDLTENREWIDSGPKTSETPDSIEQE